MKILVPDNLELGGPSIVSCLPGTFHLPHKVVGSWGPTAWCLPSDPELPFGVAEMSQDVMEKLFHPKLKLIITQLSKDTSINLQQKCNCLLSVAGCVILSLAFTIIELYA